MPATVAWIIGGLAVVGAVGVTVAVATSGPGGDDAVVSDVVDGDTIDVTVDGRDERVRLLNIDTPESVQPGEPVQCLGPEATAFLEELLPVGTPVRLEYDDVRTDGYGRTLAGVFLSDRLVNAEIARAGLAAAAVVDGNDRFLPPVEEAVRLARAASVGLHAPDVPCTIPALVAQLDRTVADNPVVTPPPTAAPADFVLAANAPMVVFEAADALIDLLDDTGHPVVDAVDRDARDRYRERVDDIRSTAMSERTRLVTAGQQRERDEEARLAEEARVAEEARRAEEEARRAEEAREAERRAAEERAAEQRRADRSRESGGDSGGSGSGSSGGSSGGGSGGSPYPGYTGPRCYEPGGVVWHPC